MVVLLSAPVCVPGSYPRCCVPSSTAGTRSARPWHTAPVQYSQQHVVCHDVYCWQVTESVMSWQSEVLLLLLASTARKYCSWRWR